MTPVESSAPQPSYWEGRSDLLYYRCVEMFVAGFAPKGRSIIDIGSNQAPLLEQFTWFKKRVSLDLRQPYRSENVKGVKADFLSFTPKQTFDLAMCLQVLEHVEDPSAFAQKLFAIARNVLISIPYLWPENTTRSHIHNVLDEKSLEQWTGRPATFSYIVQEPFSISPTSRRIIAYYHGSSKPFSLRAAQKAFRRSKFSRAGTTPEVAPPSPPAEA